MITKSGHRRKIVYKRSIGLIGQSDTLSDDGNADDISRVGTYRTKNTFSSYEAESDQLPESDHPTHAKDDHFGANDHFERGSEKPLNCPMNPANVDGIRVSSSDKSSDKALLSDEAKLSDESDQRLQSDHFHRTSPQSDQLEPQSDQSVIIRPGDRVKYCGGVRSMVRLCGSKQLEVVEVSALVATVKHMSWLVTQSVPLNELRRV